MPTEQTDKSKYPSRYSPSQFVTAAQYIIELTCEQAAIRERRELPIQFWKLPQWKTLYLGQLRAVHALLKKYSTTAIISVVKAKKINNLRPKWVEELINQEQLNINAKIPQEKLEQTEIVRYDSEKVTFSQPSVSNNKLSKLMELDNE